MLGDAGFPRRVRRLKRLDGDKPRPLCHQVFTLNRSNRYSVVLITLRARQIVQPAQKHGATSIRQQVFNCITAAAASDIDILSKNNI